MRIEDIIWRGWSSIVSGTASRFIFRVDTKRSSVTAAKMDGSETDVGVLGTGVGESERKGTWEAIASGSFGN